MHPVDLAQDATYAIALDGGVGAPSRRKSDLQRHVVARRLTRNDAVEQSNAADRNSVDIVPASIKKRPDEATTLQPMGARKGVPAFPGFFAFVLLSGQRCASKPACRSLRH